MSRPLTVALLSASDDMSAMAEAWRARHPGHDVRLAQALGDPAEIDVAVCWFPPPGVLASLPRLRLIQSVGAGIEHLLHDPLLPRHLPAFRIIDPQMAEGMAAYVSWAVISAQRGMSRYTEAQRAGLWATAEVEPPRQHRVGILGLGALGLNCARTLSALGYRVVGWSRSAKPDLPAAVEGFVGAAQLPAFLGRCDSLVCLLPLTAQTHGMLDAALFAQLPVGAHLINVGRGDHLVEADLLAALSSGQLGLATLDTFSVEPLPAGHAFWGHPQVRITPHVATRTPLDVIAAQLLENLQGLSHDTPSARQVNWARGY
ncbi:2-hydroxyacid dehydrogenase [Pseudomonas nabeulensis]|nr:glyoxylate/hydroxypyruvate reductase A [Pseudomonas nabeulensis]